MGKKKRRRQKDKKRRHGIRGSSEELGTEGSGDTDDPDEELEPPITLDEFRELRDEFFASIPARIQALKQEVVEAMARSTRSTS